MADERYGPARLSGLRAGRRRWPGVVRTSAGEGHGPRPGPRPPRRAPDTPGTGTPPGAGHRDPTGPAGIRRDGPPPRPPGPGRAWGPGSCPGPRAGPGRPSPEAGTPAPEPPGQGCRT